METRKVMDVKVGGNFGCSDHEMELTIPRGGNRTKTSTTTLDFRRVDSNFFRHLGRIRWNMALERKEL